MRGLHLGGGVLVSLLASFAISAQANAVPQLQRIIGKPLSAGAHPRDCGAQAAAITWLMGGAAGVLTGAEATPGRCDENHPPDPESVNLQGMVVEDALNKLVEIDQRYRWAEVDGVIVMRPLEAWSDATNPLSRPIDGFTMRDRNYRGALDLFRSALFVEPPSTTPDYEGSDELLRRKFSVNTQRGPSIDALNTIVRAHGALSWYVEYKTAPASIDGMVIHLHTFDNEGTLTQRHTQP